MADANVGSVQISLDIEVGSSVEKQIESISENIADKLKRNIEKSTEKSDLSKSIGKSLSSVTNKSFEIGNKIGKKISDGIKKATSKALEQKNISRAVNGTSNIATPKIKSGVSVDDLTNQRDNSIAMQENLNAQIYELQKQLSNATDMQRKGVVTEEMLKLENRIISLKSKSDALTSSIRNLDNTIDNFDSEQSTNAMNKLDNSIKKVTNTSKRAKRPLIDLGGVGRSLIRQFVGVTLLIRTVGQAVRKFFQSFVAGLKTNKEFTNSLNQVKSNLATAFQPIFDAVLPAINALMSGLAKVTAYLATFISMLFGKSVKASNANAKALDNAKKSAEGYGKAMNKVAGFDQLNDMTEDAGGGGSAGIGDINIDDAEVGKLEGIFAKLFEKIQPFIDIIKNLDFSPLSKAFDNLWSATKPIIDRLGDALAWFMNKVLGPLIKWVTEKFAPTAINVIAAALRLLEPILSAVGVAGLFFWDNFLQPIASWTGGVIIAVLEGLIVVLNAVTSWMNNNKGIIEGVAIIVTSFAIAWGAVNAAIAIWNGLAAVGTAVTTGFGTAVAFLTSPIGIAVVAIGSIIAIIGLLIKNWDTVKEVAVKVWEAIKKAWNGAGAWFNSTVVQPIANFFNGLWEGVKNAAANAWNWILSLFSKGGKIFNGVTEGIVAAFKTVVNAIIGGLNKVIAVPFNAINGVLNKIRNINIPLVGKPFAGLWGENPMPVPKIPLLAGGGVLDKPTLNIAGEYPGARSNPEIVTPQNIMAETFRSVMKEFMDAFRESGNVSSEMIHLVINVGGKKLLDTMIDSAKDYARQTGKEVSFNV